MFLGVEKTCPRERGHGSQLKPPIYDHPPLDFFAGVLWPGRIVNAYEWTFDLTIKEYPTRDEFIEQGQALRTQLP